METGATAVDQKGREDRTLGRIGGLEVALAGSQAELDASFALRFAVFHHEFGALNDPVSVSTGQDRDHFDAFCDHLIVIDTERALPIENQIVGTYRLLPHDKAQQTGFYSAQEFTVQALVDRHPARRFLELGRSCVLPPYRGRRTIELLWQGIWAYCRRHSIDVMMGCASFGGTERKEFQQGLSFLHHFAASEKEWSVDAQGPTAFSTDLLPADHIEQKRALAELPPLIKGYLRLGAHFATSALIDEAFKSIDVFVTLPIENISQRYITHYGQDAQRFAA
ncbi:MAG: GNAT family N-acyltransferase [Pseudomonadota bacterium]